MKAFKILLLISTFLLFLGGLWFYLEHSPPSKETVKQEFLKKNPDLKDAEIKSIELGFEYVERDVLMYFIKFEKPESEENLMDEFTVKQKWNFRWHWCDDQTEKKCD